MRLPFGWIIPKPPPAPPEPPSPPTDELERLQSENRALKIKNGWLTQKSDGMQRKLSNVVRVLNGLEPLPMPTSRLDNT